MPFRVKREYDFFVPITTCQVRLEFSGSDLLGTPSQTTSPPIGDTRARHQLTLGIIIPSLSIISNIHATCVCVSGGGITKKTTLFEHCENFTFVLTGPNRLPY